MRHAYVVDTLEETEETGVLVVKPVVIPVDDGGDAAHHPAVLPRQKELRFGIGIKRMLLAVQQLLHRDPQRRHPIRIIAVDSKGSSMNSWSAFLPSTAVTSIPPNHSPFGDNLRYSLGAVKIRTTAITIPANTSTV